MHFILECPSQCWYIVCTTSLHNYSVCIMAFLSLKGLWYSCTLEHPYIPCLLASHCCLLGRVAGDRMEEERKGSGRNRKWKGRLWLSCHADHGAPLEVLGHCVCVAMDAPKVKQCIVLYMYVWHSAAHSMLFALSKEAELFVNYNKIWLCSHQ